MFAQAEETFGGPGALIIDINDVLYFDVSVWAHVFALGDRIA
jgi:hypothetical protein